jgi:hypothetical protein
LKNNTKSLNLFQLELQFSCYVPSLIAAASIATAVHGFQSEHKPWKSYEIFLNILEEIIGIDAQ